MIRLLPFIILTACDLTTKTVIAECQLVETQAACASACVDLPDGSYPAYAVQCGGPGTEADDCVEAYWTIQGDDQGDRLCATCTSIEGDSGEDGPWDYLRIGVVECLDETGAVISMTSDSPR